MYSVKKAFFIILFMLAWIVLLPAEEGMASWYGGKFQGRKTASGEVFDTYKFTAAHKTLPFDTIVRVTNLDNLKSTVVRITDRGPFVEGRVIDLSKVAAEELDMMKTGVARVRVEIVSPANAKGFFRIQIASYKERENALKSKALLTDKDFTVYFEHTSNGHIRVSVDNIGLDDLEKAKNSLRALGFENFLVKRVN